MFGWTKQSAPGGSVKKRPRTMPYIERLRTGEGSRVGPFCPDPPYPRVQLCQRPKSIGVRSCRSRVMMNDWILSPWAPVESKPRSRPDHSLTGCNTRNRSSLVFVETVQTMRGSPGIFESGSSMINPVDSTLPKLPTCPNKGVHRRYHVSCFSLQIFKSFIVRGVSGTC